MTHITKTLYILVLTLVMGHTRGDESIPTIQVTQTNNNNGFAILKTKEKLIIEKYYKVLHLLNITKYREDAENLQRNIERLNISTNDPSLMLVMIEFNSLLHNIKALTPISLYRKKRGLINLGGKIFKYIIGAMDSEDADEIYKHLNNLDINTKNTIDAVNEQVIINNDLIKTIGETKDYIRQQTQTVEKYMYEIQNRTNAIIENEGKFQVLFQIYILIQKLNRLTEKFSDIILLSKLDLLAHDIFNNNEMMKYNITIETMPFIKANVIFHNDLIIFAIKIPQFTQGKYYNTLVIPFPNSKKEELDIPVTRVIVHNKTVYKYTEETVKQGNLEKISNTCLRNILQPNNTCKFRINSIQSITQLEDSTIIAKNLPLTEIKHDCNQENLFIEGNAIILFHLCKIQVNNDEFINEYDVFSYSFVLPQINLNMTKFIDNITLETLNDETIENRKLIRHVEFNTKNITYISYSTIVIIMLII